MLDKIPSELIEKFFFLLPIKDVVRLTSVCKSWYKFITSPSFMYLHLNSSISNTPSRVILSLTKEDDADTERYYLHRDNQAFEEIEELHLPPNPNAEISICGSSNGVFCCSYHDHINTVYGQRLILWNPSLRKSLILHKPRDAQLLNHHQQYNVGFGFMPSTTNFKIVRLMYATTSYSKCVVPPEAEIYESHTGSWRELNASELSYALTLECNHALLKGIVHWPACDPHRVKGTSTYGGLIVSFDLTSEKFGTLMLPGCVQYDDEADYFCVFTMKEHLYLLHCNQQSIIFKMKEYGVLESWEKLFSFGTTYFIPLFLRENGDILLAEVIDAVLDKHSLVSCDPKTNEKVDLGVHEDGLCFCSAYAYVDSLFLVSDSNNGKLKEI